MVFSQFPSGNHDGPKAFSTSPIKIPYNLEHDSLDFVTIEEIEKMSSDKFLSFIDSPREKVSATTISKIWEFANSSTLDIQKRLIFLDYFGSIATIDWLENLTAQYFIINNKQLKSMLLGDIQDVYQKYLPMVNHPSQYELLKEFYSKLLGKNLPPKDSERVMRALILLNFDKDILRQLDDIKRHLENINPYTRIGLKTGLANKFKELETNFILEIISMLNDENNIEYDERFILYIVDNLSRGLERLDINLKIPIKNYLDEVKFKLDHPTLLQKQNFSMFALGAWLEASALINSHSLTDAGSYIANYLTGLKNTKEQKNYVIGFSNSKYMQEAFENEPILKQFKQQNKAIYLNTVGAI